MKEARHKRPHTVWFHLHETSRKGHSIDRKQISGFLGWRVWKGVNHKWAWEVLLGWWKLSKTDLWWWLYHLVNLPKIIELHTHTWTGWILCYVKYTWINLFWKEKQTKHSLCQFLSAREKTPRIQGPQRNGTLGKYLRLSAGSLGKLGSRIREKLVIYHIHKDINLDLNYIQLWLVKGELSLHHLSTKMTLNPIKSKITLNGVSTIFHTQCPEFNQKWPSKTRDRTICLYGGKNKQEKQIHRWPWFGNYQTWTLK